MCVLLMDQRFTGPARHLISDAQICDNGHYKHDKLVGEVTLIHCGEQLVKRETIIVLVV